MDRYNHVTVITSRGCPNRCSFCTVHPTVGRVNRRRSVENVIAEIENYVENYGVKTINVEDDNFSYDFKRANQILDALIERDWDISFNLPNGITAINIDEDMIRKYGKVKMDESFIGLETVEKSRLKKISKPFTSLERVAYLADLFKKYGMHVGASLIVGFPDQTIDDMINDIICLVDRNIEFGTANPLYPMPMTELYAECINKGYISETLDYTWFDEFNFPLHTDCYTRRDMYDIWSCSLVYDYYTEMLDIMKKGFGEEEQIIRLFNELGYGTAFKTNSGIYCIPNCKDTFSSKMLTNNYNHHSNIFVDFITGDIIANLFSLYTGNRYEAWQTESSLTPNGRVAFVIRKESDQLDNVAGKLANAIHGHH